MTDVRGDRAVFGTDDNVNEFDDVDDAFECECECRWCTDRTDETDDDVDLRPRSPADARRKEECGVIGAGESDERRRMLVGVCAVGAAAAADDALLAGIMATVRVDRGGCDARSGVDAPCWPGLFPGAGLALEPGDLARLASHCLMWLSWARMGCFCQRLRLRLRIVVGDSGSGLEVAICKVLFRDRLPGSLGGGGGGGG